MHEAAPIKQLLLTVQFQPAMVGLNIMDLAGIRFLFAEEYPIFNQVSRAGPMGFRPEYVVPQFGVSTGMPRLRFLSGDLTHEILFQDDRVSVGWTRTSAFDAASGYPGFEAILIRLKNAISKIRTYLISIGQPDFSISSGEIAYWDVFVVRDGDSFGDSLPKIFNFFDAKNPIHPTGMNLVWNSELGVSGVEGYSQTSIVGPEATAQGRLIANMQSSAHFDLSDLSVEQSPQRFLSVRGEIGRMFQELVNPASFAMSDS